MRSAINAVCAVAWSVAALLITTDEQGVVLVLAAIALGALVGRAWCSRFRW